MRASQILCVLVGSVVGFSTSLSAQIAPQPPVKAEPLLKAEVPPPQPPRPVVQPPTPPPPPEPLPDYQQIEPGESEGRLWLRPEPTDLLALGHNPLVNAPMIARLAPTLSQRRSAMTALLLANPDNAAQMMDPNFAKINLGDPSTLENARAVLRPLSEVGTLSTRLNSSGLINSRVRQLNQLINRDYQTTLTSTVRAENPVNEEEQTAATAANTTIGEMLFEFTVTEPRFAYGLLAAELFDKLDAALQQISLTPASTAILRESRGGVMAQSWPVDRAEAARAAILAVPMDERNKLMTWASENQVEAEFPAPPDSTVSFREMTNQERLNALVAAYAGRPFNWMDYVAD